MPRVLHLYKDVCPPVYGGIEMVLGKLAMAQARLGWDVTVAVSGPVDDAWGRATGVHAVSVGEWGRLLSNPIAPGFLKVLREVPYDILHLHLPCPTAVAAALMAGNPKAPWVVSYQSDIVRQKITGRLYAPIEKHFFSKVSRILVSSQRLLETSHALKGFESRCRVAQLGFSGDDLTEEDHRQGEIIRQQYGNRPIVLFVGRFRWYKGLPVLIEAMDHANATLLAVGSGTPKQEARVLEQVARMKHPDRVVLLGSVDNLAPLFAAADVFCLPSTHRAEAFGYVLLEAFHAGVPAITTELGTGTSFVNQDGVTGFVIPPLDSNALSGAICRIVVDRAFRDRLGAAARRRVLQEFSLEKMVDEIMRGYAEALAGEA